MARTLKQQIRKIIKEYYGDALANYARMAGDDELLDTFVNALAHAIKPYRVSSPSIGCTCKLICFDGHPSPIDIELGKRIQILRIQSAVSIKELATRMGVHPDYIDELERGKLTPGDDIRETVAHALDMPYAEAYLSQDLDETAETKAWIRYTISVYFGRSLWAFHPEVSYEESIGPFVRALVELDGFGQRITSPSPVTPSLGDMVDSEMRMREAVPERSMTPKVAAETRSLVKSQKVKLNISPTRPRVGQSDRAPISEKLAKPETHYNGECV